MPNFVKILIALLALAGLLASTACNGPKVFNYGGSDPNITVEQG